MGTYQHEPWVKPGTVVPVYSANGWDGIWDIIQATSVTGQQVV